MTQHAIREAGRMVIASSLQIVFLPAAVWVETVADCLACSPSPSAVIHPAAEMMGRAPGGARAEQARGPAVAMDVRVPVEDVDEGAADAGEGVRAQR